MHLFLACQKRSARIPEGRRNDHLGLKAIQGVAQGVGHISREGVRVKRFGQFGPVVAWSFHLTTSELLAVLNKRSLERNAETHIRPCLTQSN